MGPTIVEMRQATKTTRLMPIPDSPAIVERDGPQARTPDAGDVEWCLHFGGADEFRVVQFVEGIRDMRAHRPLCALQPQSQIDELVCRLLEVIGGIPVVLPDERRVRASAQYQVVAQAMRPIQR